MNRFLSVAAASIAAIALAASSSSAAILLTPGSATIAKGASVPLSIIASTTSGDVIDSVDLNASVTGATRAPIVDVDFTTGSILAGGTKTAVYTADPYFPEYSYDGATPVTATGKVFTLLFNTSSLAPGSTFTVNLYDSQFPTQFSQGSTLRASSGPSFTVTVAAVPEPTTLAATAAVGALLAVRRRRA